VFRALALAVPFTTLSKFEALLTLDSMDTIVKLFRVTMIEKTLAEACCGEQQ